MREGGGTVLKKFQFGPKIRWGKGGGRAPRDPPLEPPIICTPSCQWFHICTVLICVHSNLRITFVNLKQTLAVSLVLNISIRLP